MGMADTMKWMGRSAKNRAEAMSHQMKDRALQMRLDKVDEENERLRVENRTLRGAMEESQSAHERILSLLEAHRDETRAATGDEEERSHKGRWFMFLMLLAGGAWAWVKSRRSATDWSPVPSDAETPGTSGMSSAA